MTKLTIRLMGPLRADVDGQPIQDLKTNKARALLAFLAVEAKKPVRREALAGMLWPEFNEQRARANLSQALYMLRRAIGDDSAEQPLLAADRATIQLAIDHRLSVDVRTFEGAVQANKRASTQAMVRELETAVALYEGEFLDGFSLTGSPPFEIWCLTLRERLHLQMSGALTQLVDFYEREANYESALSYATWLVELDGWREEAHAALMRLLALCGRRSEALVQYEVCRRVLTEHLGIAPMRQTTALYESIRDEQLVEQSIPDSAITVQGALSPAFLAATVVTPTPILCVGRSEELSWLEDSLENALAGHGRLAFIAGEAGSGKTVLWQAFTRQTLELHPRLLVASGKGTAYTGLGDPYAMFRDIASQLCGDVATQWAAGQMTLTQVLRLWQALPMAIYTLVRDAPGLIGTFVDGANLLERGQIFAKEARLNRRQAPWLVQLESLLAGGGGAGAAGQMQTSLFDHYLRFLTTMAGRSPLLLVLDDLQWADAGTIGLLFHISRNLAGQRIFVLSAFRPEEITVGPAGVRHPLQTVVHESQKEFGEIILPLGQKADPSFVETFVDIEPNNLDKTFRTRLFELTGGHPLYTAELMRGLQERGDLFRDSLGRWRVGSELDWDTLPPRIEGVIAERIGRLPPDSRRLLQAAAVQGETFIAEVAAQALDTSETRAASALGNELSRVHRLVRAQRLEYVGDGQDRLSTYQFHHFLFQKYLYDHLDPVEKAHLHEVTGKALASRVGEDALETSVQLARHFEAAGMPDRAVYFLLQAGNHAIKLAANDEAGRHFAHGLALLDDIPATPERAQLELALQLGLGTAYQLNDGYGASVAERAYSRALDLCAQAGDSPQLVAALWPLATYATMVGDLPQGVALAEQALAIALRTEEPLIICVAHHHVGWILHHCGRLAESVAHQEEAIALYNRQYHEPMVRMFGHDFGITSLGWSAWPLCCLGFPDRALQRCHEAIVLAQSFDHPFSLMHAYGLTAQTHYLRGELVKAGEFAERTLALAEAYGFASYIAAAHFTLGAGQIGKGHFARGLEHWRIQLDLFEAGGVRLYHRGSLATLAGVLTQLGQLGEAQIALAEADAIGYHDYTDALIETFRGQLLAAQGHGPEEVEACFLYAIQIAQEMEAKLFELQATMSLSELWQAQGRQEEARQRLAAVYNWFKEGFDTPILQAAAAMLDELA